MVLCTVMQVRWCPFGWSLASMSHARGLPSRIAPCLIGFYLQGASASGPGDPSGAGGLGEPSGEKAGGEEGLAVPIGAIGLGEPSGAELLGDLMDQVCLERGQ
jgi:hypothetical protein